MAVPRTTGRRVAAIGVAALTVLAGVPAASAQTMEGAVTGPSTSVAPFVLPVADGVEVTSLLTVGDEPTTNGYRMVGIPDGLGTYASDGDLVALMNHELVPGAGTPRRHGQDGAFMSQLRIDPETWEVVEGEDFIDPEIGYWDYAADAYTDTPQPTNPALPALEAFSRFCSGYLTSPGELLNETSGNGYDGQIFFANEESGDEGRVFGVTLDGQATQLPRLGLISWENTISADNASDTTLVMGNDDADPGELRVYVGEKQADGAPVEQAGLTNGESFGVRVEGAPDDMAFRAAYDAGDEAPFTLNPVQWDQSGAAQETEALGEGVLAFNRLEDGQFDPSSPNDYYFITTEGGEDTYNVDNSGGGGGLWRLSFDDIENPAADGTLTLLLDGTEDIGHYKPDNMTIDGHGNILIQEDPGGARALARITAYRIADGATGTVAQFDPNRFQLGGSDFITEDEESSGIVDLEGNGGEAGEFLFDAQVHTSLGLPAGEGPGTVQEFVQQGQLLHISVPDFSTVYGQITSVDDEDGGLVRFGGPGRLETAIAISQGTFPGSETVVIARSGRQYDALAGTPLANALSAPLLLNTREQLDPQVLAEIERLGAVNAVLLGGPEAQFPAVEQALVDARLDVTRLGGEDRYDTAVLIAEALAELNADEETGEVPDPEEVFVVQGSGNDPAQGFTDALSASSLAAASGAPILLTDSDDLSDETRDYIEGLATDPAVTIVGGEVAVSAEVSDELDTIAGEVARLSGSDRYATSAAVANEAVMNRGFSLSTVWIATGLDFPDALASGTAAAAQEQLVLFVDGQDLANSSATADFLAANNEAIYRAVIAGGTNAVSDDVAAEIVDLIDG